MSAAEHESDASSAQQPNERAVPTNEWTEERVDSTRRFQSFYPLSVGATERTALAGRSHEFDGQADYHMPISSYFSCALARIGVNAAHHSNENVSQNKLSNTL